MNETFILTAVRNRAISSHRGGEDAHEFTAASVRWAPLQPGSTLPGVEGSLLLLGVILLAGLGTGALFVISFLAYLQRRSMRYLLITVAVSALFLRSIIGIGTVLGYVPMPAHHLIEHSLDFIIAALILYAVLRSRPSHLGLDHEDTP